MTAAADQGEAGAFRTVRVQPAGADRTEKLFIGADLVFRGQTVFGKGSCEAASSPLDPGKIFMGTTAETVNERVQNEAADEQQEKQE